MGEIVESEAWVSFRAWYELARRAVRYHIMARFVLRESPDIVVAGNLAHTALEFALKSVLARHTTEKQRKDNFGHALPAMWEAAKKLTNSPPQRFDDVAKTIDDFWRIRYPEATARTGMIGSASQSPGSGTVLEDGRTPREPTFTLIMDDVDAFIDYLLFATGVNPETIRPELSNAAMRYLTDDNKSLEFWGQAVPDEENPALHEREHPVLAAIWDNEADAIYDDL